MPYSSPNGKAELLELAKRFLPGKVLDIGCGCGTYADLLAPYTKREDMLGIEIWKPYIDQFKLEEKYAEVINLPAHQALGVLAGAGYSVDVKRIVAAKFDLVLIGDMLEHLPRAEALEVVMRAKGLLVKDGALIISVPIGEYPQGEYEGNQYEAHLDTWEVADVVRDLKPDAFIQRGEIGICVMFKSPKTRKRFEPKVAVYGICKDEEKFISRCLGTVLINEPDEVAFCDTGSTDGTLDKLASFPAVKLLRAHFSPWRFDDARNLTLAAVSKEMDLCISIDADEMLEPGFIKALKAAWAQALLEGERVTRYNHRFMTVWDWDKGGQQVTKHFHERIHARHGYRWTHPVHEKLVSDHEVARWLTEVGMIQYPDTSKNRGFYGELLEQAVREDPRDWKLWSFLASEREAAGDLDAAAEALNEALALDSDQAFLNLTLGRLRERQGLYAAAQACFTRAFIESDLREVHMALGEYYERRGNVQKAKSCFKAALESKSETQGYMRREDAWDGSLERKLKGMR